MSVAACLRSGLAALALLGASGGCGGAGGQGPLALSWRFADGRGCPEAGVVKVTVSVDGTSLASPACADGLAPSAFMLDAVARGGHLVVEGLSPSQPLYRGTLDLDLVLDPTTVTLYAVAAR